MTTSIRELLAGFPVTVKLPILWGDQDAFGHVNNLVYLRWCETSRVEYLKRMHMWPELPPVGPGPILAAQCCHYKKPLNYPDTVYVGARVSRVGNSSFRMEHRVVSEATGVVAAEADSTLVVLDYARGVTVRVPEECRSAIEELEGNAVER
jgi:acyl-CoA thioester hydrolase